MPKNESLSAVIETHPNWYHEVPDMKVLILGNFPPAQKRWHYRFFYPNSNNNFWHVLASLNNTALVHMKGEAAVEERKKIMSNLKTGVYNIAKKIRRKGESARDTDIEILEFNDTLSLIRRSKYLTKIILAGYSAENSTAKKFIEYLEYEGVKFEKPVQITAGVEFMIPNGRRRLHCVIVNSTSRALPIKLENLLEQFRSHIDV